MKAQFPDREIAFLAGVCYRFEDETGDFKSSLFTVNSSGNAKADAYLVKCGTGEIYAGAYDPKQPDYAVVPTSLRILDTTRSPL